MKRGVATALTLFVAVLVATAIPASATVTVQWDSFEDGDISEYSGDTANATVQQDLVRYGDHALNISSSGTTRGIASTSGLQYPSPGDTWTVWMRYNDSDADMRVLWALQSESYTADGYLVEVRPTTNDIRLEVRNGGTKSNLDTTGLGQSYSDQWLNVTVSWAANGDINATVSTTSSVIGRVNASDSSFSSGGTGMAVRRNDALSRTTGTFDAEVFGTLSVYNESAPNNLVTDSVDVTFFGDEGVVEERSTTSGTVSLAGLPQNQSYIARVESANYYARSRSLGDLNADYDVYLLPSSVNTADIVFKLDDNTGNFPPSSSTLQIQRSLTKNGNTRYRTIASDAFGASNEFPITLENGERYRLLVENRRGTTRALGPYTVTGDDPDAVLPIGEVQAVGDTSDDVAFSASLTEDSGQRAVVMTYRDQTNTTTELYLNVTNRKTGNTIRQNTSVSGPFGVYQETVLVPGSAPDNVTYIVEYHAVRDGEPARNGTRIVGDIVEQIGVFELGSNLLFLLAAGLVIAVTGAVALYSASAAALVAPALATALTWLGALSIPLPLLAGAGAIGVLAAAGGAIR